jgi:hypothetical protein
LKHERSAVRVSMVDLPGMNTPQFDWNDNGFDEHPTPVPPIYQPEAAARAVRFVAEHRRRSMWVGVPTAYTILGNRVAPVFLDWYLGKTGVKGQLSRVNAVRLGSNVFEPKDDSADQGAHGAFDDTAHGRDAWSWLSMHRRSIIGVGAAAVGTISAAQTRFSRR